MILRSNIARVLCPMIRMRTTSVRPDRIRFRAVVRRSSPLSQDHLCFCKPAHLLRNNHVAPSVSILSYYYRMAQRAQQTKEDSPRYTTRFTIDCVLPLASTQLQADGCVLECLEDGHKLITPDYLRAGDLVKVQLWLEGEEDFIDIPLAVVSKVHTPWITVGVIRVSPSDRLRMKRFIHARPAMHLGKAAHLDDLLIRA